MSDNLEQCELLSILNLCHRIYHIGSVSCNNLLRTWKFLYYQVLGPI